MFRSEVVVFGLLLLCAVCGVARAEAQAPVEKPVAFNIPSQSLRSALRQFAVQADIEMLFHQEDIASRQVTAPALVGSYTVTNGLRVLLANSGLVGRLVTARMAVVQKVSLPEGIQVTQASYRQISTDPEPRETPQQIPQVLIRGTPSINVDIPRSSDDGEPVAVFGRNAIKLSQATDLSGFLRGLPSLNSPASVGGQADVFGETREIDLRGLGADQTLILLDGRRMAGFSAGGRQRQPDISIIPLEAIERIEILPATASGRHGGGATAGVVNVILRREDSEFQAIVRGDRLAGIDSGSQQFFVSDSTWFNNDRGQIFLWGSYATQGVVTVAERDLTTPGRERIAANNPGAFSLPPMADWVNLRTLDGSPLLEGVEGSTLGLPPDFDPGRDSLQGLASHVGAYRLNLAPTAQADGAGHALRARSQIQSYSATTLYQFSEIFAGDLDLRLAETRRIVPMSGADNGNFRAVFLPADAPGNVFEKDLLVSMPVMFAEGELRNRNLIGRAAGAIEAQLPSDWAARLEHTWSFSNLSMERPILLSDPSAISSGRVSIFGGPVNAEEIGASLATVETSTLRTRINESTLRFAGPALRMPAGEAEITALVERRREVLAEGGGREVLVTEEGNATIQTLMPEQTQTIDSAYAEISVPLIGAPRWGGQKRLVTQWSVRKDWYEASTATPDPLAPTDGDRLRESTSRFSAFSWMGSLRFKPVEELLIRAHCGTGFLPPSVADLMLPIERVMFSPLFTDPARGGEMLGPVQVSAGGNPMLQPEKSRSCGAGVVMDFRVPKLRFSADYVQIRKSGGIFSPSEWLFTDPTAFISQLPSRVTRAPASDSDLYKEGQITAIDASSLNVSRSQVHAWDLSLAYESSPTRFGTVRVSTLATLQPKFISQLTDLAPELNNAGIGSLAPPKYRINSSVTLARGPWVFGWDARYIPRYVVSRDAVTLLNQGSRYVSDQHYHDLYAAYTIPPSLTGSAEIHLQAGAHNVFRQDPPFDAGNIALYSRHGVTELPSFYLRLGIAF